MRTRAPRVIPSSPTDVGPRTGRQARSQDDFGQVLVAGLPEKGGTYRSLKPLLLLASHAMFSCGSGCPNAASARFTAPRSDSRTRRRTGQPQTRRRTSLACLASCEPLGLFPLLPGASSRASASRLPACRCHALIHPVMSLEFFLWTMARMGLLHDGTLPVQELVWSFVSVPLRSRGAMAQQDPRPAEPGAEGAIGDVAQAMCKQVVWVQTNVAAWIQKTQFAHAMLGPGGRLDTLPPLQIETPGTAGEASGQPKKKARTATSFKESLLQVNSSSHSLPFLRTTRSECAEQLRRCTSEAIVWRPFGPAACTRLAVPYSGWTSSRT